MIHHCIEVQRLSGAREVRTQHILKPGSSGKREKAWDDVFSLLHE